MLPKIIPDRTKEMLSLVTDPYHDRNLKVSGFPDGVNMTSVVRRLAFQTSIACPFTLDPGQTWDFHIFATPLHQATSMSSASITGNTIVYSGASVVLNTLNIFYRCYDSAGALVDVKFFSLGQSAGVISPSLDGPGRTVSLGYELHNTTAELYKSGSITVYRTNALTQRCDLRWVYGGTPMGYTADIILNMPSTLEQANLIPNARTWEAAKGVYSVCLPPKTNEYKTGVYSNLLMNINQTSSPYYGITPGYNNPATTSPSWSPLNCTGVMSSRFADKNQTYTLDLRQVLEYFPNCVSSSLLPFATTAPDYDRLFLKLYGQMINRIEPGVPVGFNSAGEWFRRIVQLAKEELPNVATLLPPQITKYTDVIGPIASKAADIALDYIETRPSPPPIPPRPKSRPAPRRAPKVPKRPAPKLPPRGQNFAARSQRFLPATRQ